MLREEYKGRKIVAKRGKDRRWGYVMVTINGEPAWASVSTDEAAEVESAKRYIDESIMRPDAYPDAWRVA